MNKVFLIMIINDRFFSNILLLCISLFCLINFRYYIYLNQYKIIHIKPIKLLNNLFYISSFYDYRLNVIRVILYNNNDININISNDKFICLLIYNNRIKKKCILTITTYISEDNTVVHMTINTDSMPEKFILNNRTFHLTNAFKANKKKKITVCIGKMIKFSAYNMLIQLIESYLYFGVDYFVVYKTSCSKNVTKVLSYYANKGILEVIEMDNNFDIKYAKYKTYAQRIKLNDCFYRSYNVTNSIIMTDLDEILWPAEEDNIIDMVNKIERNSNKEYDILIFQEKIFKRHYVKYFDRLVHNIEDCNIFDYHTCCDYTWRWPKLFIKNLSKIISVSIHSITGSIKNYTQLKVKPFIGFIRHTRRTYPYINKGLIGNWSKCNYYYKEMNIEKNSKKTKKIIGL